MTRIREIKTALPAIKNSQEEIAAYMQSTYQKSFAVNQVYADTRIESRHSVLADFQSEPTLPLFFNGHEPKMQERMAKYFQLAPALAMDAIRQLDGYANMTHLITVSCTGLAAPGLETILQEELNLSPDLQKATVNFMGCYAAIHGLRLADWIIKAEPKAKVVLVCVELCTLHFQRNYTIENLSSASLFADGAAAVMLDGDSKGLELLSFFTSANHSGKADMAWDLDENGFLMQLSRQVPVKLREGLKETLARRCRELGIPLANLTNFAIHPGGKKILEAVADELQLSDSQMESSYEVLRKYGNMSSPSILFVLKEEWEKKGANEILGLAFGPGLTMEAVYLKV